MRSPEEEPSLRMALMLEPNPADNLIFQTAARAVPSAQQALTSTTLHRIVGKSVAEFGGLKARALFLSAFSAFVGSMSEEPMAKQAAEKLRLPSQIMNQMPAGAKQAAGKIEIVGAIEENNPQGLKPRPILRHLRHG